MGERDFRKQFIKIIDDSVKCLSEDEYNNFYNFIEKVYDMEFKSLNTSNGLDDLDKIFKRNCVVNVIISKLVIELTVIDIDLDVVFKNMRDTVNEINNTTKVIFDGGMSMEHAFKFEKKHTLLWNYVTLFKLFAGDIKVEVLVKYADKYKDLKR
jgi:hypothetical protein